ncbi:hypothetical protein MUP77_12890 [Candidatus Bathyarchaeota archaeon]|nr:hypothetical protein [Candidatus Bathyarchaeota archaeon]
MSRKNPTKERGIISLVNIRYSSVDKGDWKATEDYLNDLLEKRGLETFLFIRAFGKDQVWAVSSSKNVHSVEKIQQKPYVIDVAVLTRSLPFNQKVFGDIIKKELPVGYILLKKRNAILEHIKDSIEHAGGSPFLVAAIDHPEGYTHCVVVTIGTADIAELNETVYRFAKDMKCRDWECMLGAKHGWPKAHEEPRRKLEIGNEIGQIIKNWYEAAEQGQLTEEERKLIEGRFEIKLPDSKK